jgi:hypothetical protein
VHRAWLASPAGDGSLCLESSAGLGGPESRREQPDGIEPILKSAFVHRKHLHGEQVLGLGHGDGTNAFDGARATISLSIPELAVRRSTVTPSGDRRQTVASLFASSCSTRAITSYRLMRKSRTIASISASSRTSTARSRSGVKRTSARRETPKPPTRANGFPGRRSRADALECRPDIRFGHCRRATLEIAGSSMSARSREFTALESRGHGSSQKLITLGAPRRSLSRAAAADTTPRKTPYPPAAAP